jgi:hypothetical protein
MFIRQTYLIRLCIHSGTYLEIKKWKKYLVKYKLMINRFLSVCNEKNILSFQELTPRAQAEPIKKST